MHPNFNYIPRKNTKMPLDFEDASLIESNFD